MRVGRAERAIHHSMLTTSPLSVLFPRTSKDDDIGLIGVASRAVCDVNVLLLTRGQGHSCQQEQGTLSRLQRRVEAYRRIEAFSKGLWIRHVKGHSNHECGE